MAEGGNVLDEARALVKKRLAEIDAERKQLERACAEICAKARKRSDKARRRGPGRPRGSGTTRRRRRRGGTRADEAVKLVTANPGITASGIAKQMKIKPNYLYRVLGDLQKEGRVKKRGREYFPAG
jgi:hypothetical protein